MVRGWIGSPRFQTAKKTLSRRGTPKPLAGSPTLTDGDVAGSPQRQGGIPTLKQDHQGKMLGEAVGHLKRMSGAKQRTAAFHEFSQQIHHASKGAWSATPGPTVDGGTLFMGSLGRTLVIRRDGRMLVGDVGGGAFSMGKNQNGVSTLRP